MVQDDGRCEYSLGWIERPQTNYPGSPDSWSERQLLPGWSVVYDDGHEVQTCAVLGGTALVTKAEGPGRPIMWSVELGGSRDGRVDSASAAQLAAEDAARALLTELAEALGVRLQAEPCQWTRKWGSLFSACGSDFEADDAAWMPYCPGCGRPVETVEDGE